MVWQLFPPIRNLSNTAWLDYSLFISDYIVQASLTKCYFKSTEYLSYDVIVWYTRIDVTEGVLQKLEDMSLWNKEYVSEYNDPEFQEFYWILYPVRLFDIKLMQCNLCSPHVRESNKGKDSMWPELEPLFVHAQDLCTKRNICSF